MLDSLFIFIIMLLIQNNRTLQYQQLTYSERLRKLQLPSLKYRCYRGDQIQAYNYKIINSNGLDDKVPGFFHKVYKLSTKTRGADYKYFSNQCSTNTRKYNFGNRVTKEWNSLSITTKTAPNLNAFKNLLDKDSKRNISNFDFDE